jgi:ubiquinone/menaquinone biosynthesis C-methylase UbiE
VDNSLRARVGSTLQKISKSVGGAATRPTFADRSNYKLTWDSLAESYSEAKRVVAGYEDEAQFDLTAQHTIDIIEQNAGINASDVALEIGCGVGRVGKVLSRRVTTWIGTDISRNMLAHAAVRLNGIHNCVLKELGTVGLREISDQSVDLVYCTVVFMHLLEWDRYRYVAESFRVLKHGGRCFFDNVDITSDHGWKVFSAGYGFDVETRPSQLSMTSTGDELRTYAEKAGFQNIGIHRWDNAWVGVTGVKP